MEKQSGQSLIEVLVALTVVVIMIVALIAFILSGLKNAQFAQNQSKATKLAQETMDQIKNIRDRNGDVFYGFSQKFSVLWGVNMSTVYFNLEQPANSPPSLAQITDLSRKDVNLTGGNEGFKRQIIFEDSADSLNILYYAKAKKITVIIKWTDSTGEHESNIQTILSPGI